MPVHVTTDTAQSLSNKSFSGATRFNGDVTISGNLSCNGTQTFQNTIFTTTSAISVVHVGSGPALWVGNNGTGDIASFYDIDAGVEVLHVGGNNGTFPNVGVKTSTPNVDFTVNGAISASSVIYSLSGNSDQWNNAYSTVQTSSASWNPAGSYLPLSGGTLTGALVGTSGTFPTATIGGLFMSGLFSGLVFNNGWWTNGSDIRFGNTGRLTFASGSAPGNAADVILLRDSANTLALRNGINAQTNRIYNTFTDANNFERGFNRWRGSQFSATISGTTMTITVAAVGDFVLGQKIVGTGVTANTLVNTLLTGTLGAVGSTYTVSISQTVATATVMNSYSDAFEIGTEKLGAGLSARPISFVTDGVDRWSITAGGSLLAAANDTYDIGSSGRRTRSIYCGDLYTSRSVNANDNVFLGNNFGGGDLSLTSPLGVVQLRPGAAGTLYQRNGTAPQKIWVANTYTNDTNYERAVFGFTSNVLRIGTENAGTGVARPIDFVVGSTSLMSITSASGTFTANNNSQAFTIKQNGLGNGLVLWRANGGAAGPPLVVVDVNGSTVIASISRSGQFNSAWGYTATARGTSTFSVGGEESTGWGATGFNDKLIVGYNNNVETVRFSGTASIFSVPVITPSLSATNVVYASGGNSTQWNNVYSTVQTSSASWGGGAAIEDANNIIGLSMFL